MTNPDVVMAVVEVIKEDSKKAKDVYVFDNTSAGLFTRVVFTMEKLAKRIKKVGAIPLYLDEQKSMLYDFKGEVLDKPIPIPIILYDNLIKNKDKNTYINVPKLKTHTQCDATICIKNHHGFLYDKEKIFRHHLINQKILDIMKVFTPDFNIVDALSVCNHGSYAYNLEWHLPMGLIFAGPDEDIDNYDFDFRIPVFRKQIKPWVVDLLPSQWAIPKINHPDIIQYDPTNGLYSNGADYNLCGNARG